MYSIKGAQVRHRSMTIWQLQQRIWMMTKVHGTKRRGGSARAAEGRDGDGNGGRKRGMG